MRCAYSLAQPYRIAVACLFVCLYVCLFVCLFALVWRAIEQLGAIGDLYCLTRFFCFVLKLSVQIFY